MVLDLLLGGYLIASFVFFFFYSFFLGDYMIAIKHSISSLTLVSYWWGYGTIWQCDFKSWGLKYLKFRLSYHYCSLASRSLPYTYGSLQVPKPLNFFLEAHSDEKSVKQIIRLILSKFIRRQPGRSDSEWANMWRDMQYLREKAFSFLDLEYILVEFCRGLLKAGKFSLGRNYLKGTSSVALAPEKAENLVIQAAREYFFSASSLACSEVSFK